MISNELFYEEESSDATFTSRIQELQRPFETYPVKFEIPDLWCNFDSPHSDLVPHRLSPCNDVFFLFALIANVHKWVVEAGGEGGEQNEH